MATHTVMYEVKDHIALLTLIESVNFIGKRTMEYNVTISITA
jgi:hypothetical protein